MTNIEANISARISTPSGEGESHSEEFERIVEFLRENPHVFVAERARAAVEEAFDLGNILLVEVPNNGEFDIEGTAFVYDFLEESYIEIGTLNIPRLGGFDLQKLLVVLTALRFLLRERSRPKAVFATFNKDNTRQYEKLTSAFMEPWNDPPEELREAKSHTIVHGAEHPIYFRFNEDFLPEACRYLLDMLDCSAPLRRINRHSRIHEILQLSEIRHFVVRRMLDRVREIAGR